MENIQKAPEAQNKVMWFTFLLTTTFFLPVKQFDETDFIVLLVIPFLTNGLVEISFIRENFSLAIKKKLYEFISGVEISVALLSTLVLYAWYTQGETNPELEPLFVACGVTVAAVERARKRAKKNIEE